MKPIPSTADVFLKLSGAYLAVFAGALCSSFLCAGLVILYYQRQFDVMSLKTIAPVLVLISLCVALAGFILRHERWLFKFAAGALLAPFTGFLVIQFFY